MPAPSIVLLAGPNGAGKTTAAPTVLRDTLAVSEFVNADVLASGLSAFASETVSFAAGRVMIARLNELAAKRVSFAFETTLASRVFGPWIQKQIAAGYAFRLVFFSIATADLAVQRVRERVQSGGHDVAADVVRRRYKAGLRNLFQIYLPLATTWRVYDNSVSLRLIAAGGMQVPPSIHDPALWAELQKSYGQGK